MTSAEFRADPELRKRVEEWLSTPEFLLALEIVKNIGEESDAEVLADPIASVRLLSQSVGRSHFVRDFKSLSLPIATPETMPLETFGTGHSIDEFDRPEDTKPTPP